MQQAIEADAFDVASQLDYEFHALIVTVAGNRVIGEILRESAEMMRESQRLPYYRRGARTATFTEHGAIIEALAARQPDQPSKPCSATSCWPRARRRALSYRRRARRLSPRRPAQGNDGPPARARCAWCMRCRLMPALACRPVRQYASR